MCADVLALSMIRDRGDEVKMRQRHRGQVAKSAVSDYDNVRREMRMLHSVAKGEYFRVACAHW
jgi:hypothetical protein